MLFWYINICLAPREVLKPEPERRAFQHSPRGPADVNVSEKHVWSLLLHKNILSLENFEQNASKSSFFLYLRTFWKCRFKAKTNANLT